MKAILPTNSNPGSAPILVLGGNGKTGRRVAQRLTALGHTVRIGSRSATPAFDWDAPHEWDAVLKGVRAVYLAYHPDLAAPGAAEAITQLVERAHAHAIERLVLLSGRGEEEAQRCEEIVQRSGIAHTIVRCAWFNQNFSENFLRDMVLDGVVALPVDGVREPFVDADDIADVAVAALTEDGHDGQLYELTGPELLTFAEATAKIAAATGRTIDFQPIEHEEFMAGVRAMNLSPALCELLDYLFTVVLDGHNASLADGVQRALGRPPRSFSSFAQTAAAADMWKN